MGDMDYTPLSPFRFQSQLGSEIKRMYKEGENVIKLSLARVIKVNYKYNTVEVMTTLHKNSTSKNPGDNGKFSARLPVSFSGRTPDGKVYGTNTMVTVGSLVLIGFLEGNKDNPIVLNIYGDVDNQSMLTRTTMTSADESDEDIQRELWQLFSLYPSMTYKNIDGRGNREVTFSGKSFMYITDTDPENAYVQDGAFDYADLPSSRYANGELIEPVSPNSPTMLYVHQGVYDDHRVTFFLKADGTLRVGSRHLDGKGITYQEMKTDGTYSIVQKHDTANPEEKSAKYAKFEITKEGDVSIQSIDHRMDITSTGVLVDGKPIGSGGGGGGDLEIIKELQDKVDGLTTTITLMNGKIESKVEKVEISLDLEGIRQDQQKLLDSIRDQIGKLSTALKNMQDYMNTAFQDGTVTDDKKKQVTDYKAFISKEKAALDQQYTQISSDPYLPKSYKDTLSVTKENLDNRHIALFNTIDISMLDGVITSDEKVAIQQAFDGYNQSIASIQAAFESAMDAILTARIKEAQDNAMKYRDQEMKRIGSTITQLADSITSKVESEQYTKDIQDIKSTMATKEEQQEIKDTVDQAKKDIDDALTNLPYRVEVGSTNGNIFKNGNIDTVIYATVYRGKDDITSQVLDSELIWNRVSDDEPGDLEWNKNHIGIGKSFRVTRTDIPFKATFTCDLDN